MPDPTHMRKALLAVPVGELFLIVGGKNPPVLYEKVDRKTVVCRVLNTGAIPEKEWEHKITTARFEPEARVMQLTASDQIARRMLVVHGLGAKAIEVPNE